MPDDCQTIEPLLAAYALASLDKEDTARVDAHLPCTNCSRLLAEYQTVADGLLMAVPEVSPPDRVRRELVRRVGASDGGFSARVEAPDRRFSLWRLALGVGVAGLLLVNLLLLQQVAGLRQDQDRLQQELGAGQIAQAIAAYPAAQSILLEGQSAYGTVVFDPDRPVAAMYAWGLDSLPAGQTYQVWLRTGPDGRVSGGTFHSTGGKTFTLVVVRAPDPLQSYTGVGVTIEPEGGSQAPSGPNVLAGDF